MPRNVKENVYQAELKKKIEGLLPGCYVLKNDPSFFQGFPDLTILYKGKHAVLEVKRTRNAKHQPNQDHYIEDLGKWSYSAFIFPENEEEVLDGLQRSLEA